MESLGKLVFSLGLGAVNLMLRGYAISVLWGWFVVPKFGLPPLTVMQGYGLGLVTGLFIEPFSGVYASQQMGKEFEGASKTFMLFFCSAFASVWALLFGWIVKHFV